MMMNAAQSIPGRQRGVALISVLLVFALMAIVTADLATRHSRDIRKTANLLSSKQAYYYALAGEQFSRQLLFRDYEDPEAQSVDSFTDLWYRIDPFLEIDNGSLSIDIVDLQGRFNLNNLVDANGAVNGAAVTQFQQLLTTLELDRKLANELLDWIDRDSSVRSNGAEDSDYVASNLASSYATGNQPLADRSELRLLKSMQPEDYAALKNHVVALPQQVNSRVVGISRYNLNTLDPVVAEALLPGTNASRFSQRQQQGGYKTVGEWLSGGEVSGASVIQPYLSTSSEFFEITVKAVYDGRVSVSRSQVYRDSRDGKLTLVKRQRGFE